MTELRCLTGIRGLAAWLVVLYHLRVAAGATFPDWLHMVLAKGYLAVDFFFMLSGFVLWLNYHHKLRAGGLAAMPRFIGRRIARIWPLHFVVLAGGVAFAGALAWRGTPDPVQFPWAELPLHLLLIHNWGFTGTLTWNDPSWSISCELAAYLLFPLLVLAVDWRRLPSETLVLIAVLLTFALSGIMAWHGASDLNHAIPRTGLTRALAEFAIGTIAAALWLRWRHLPAQRLLAFAPLALGTAALCLALQPETQAVPVVFAIALLGLALWGDRRNPLGWRPIHYLGRISYATYLIHYLLFIAFKLPLASADNLSPALIGLYLLLTLAASVLLHHLVELPGQGLFNRAFDRLLRRPRNEEEQQGIGRECSPISTTSSSPASPASGAAATGNISTPTGTASPIATRSTG